MTGKWTDGRTGRTDRHGNLKCRVEGDFRKNKAVYTAALVADGWAGAENLEK